MGDTTRRQGSWTGLLFFLLVGGCSDSPTAGALDLALPDQAPADAGQAADAADAAHGGVDQTADLAPPPPPASCTGYAKLTGDITVKLQHGGEQRVAYVHLPKGYDGTKKVGLVLNFHGYGSNAQQQALYTDLAAAAYHMDMVAVHPQGLAGPVGTRGWNAGGCCGSSTLKKVDDVGFVAALIKELSVKICVDPKRVYATGMSNGAFFAYRLACQLSDRIAAVAPVAGVNTMAPCQTTRPVPVLHFHGTSDLYVAYKGNTLLDWPGAEKSVKEMAAKNGCSTTVKEVYKKGDVLCEAYQACKDSAEVRLCTVNGGGHTWPGALDIPIPWLGKKTKDISATNAMLDFFKAHPMK